MNMRNIIGEVDRDKTHTLTETVPPATGVIIEEIIITRTEIMPTRIRDRIVTEIIIHQIETTRITGRIIIIIIITIILTTTIVLITTCLLYTSRCV